MIDESSVRRMAAMWAEAVYSQVIRLEAAVDRFQAAAGDEQFRDAYEAIEDPELREAWKAHYRAATGRLAAPTVWDVGLAKYFLLLVAAQLNKCVELLPSDDQPAFTEPELLRDLRNFDEHWEDPHGPAGTRLRQRIPDIVPGRLSYTKNEIWIEGVALSNIWSWARVVHQRVRDSAAGAGQPIPTSEWDWP